jgi:hypothetical protein
LHILLLDTTLLHLQSYNQRQQCHLSVVVVEEEDKPQRNPEMLLK